MSTDPAISTAKGYRLIIAARPASASRYASMGLTAGRGVPAVGIHTAWDRRCLVIGGTGVDERADVERGSRAAGAADRDQRLTGLIAVDPAPAAVGVPAEPERPRVGGGGPQLQSVAGQSQDEVGWPPVPAAEQAEQVAAYLRRSPFGREMRLVVGQDGEQVGAERPAEAGR